MFRNDARGEGRPVAWVRDGFTTIKQVSALAIVNRHYAYRPAWGDPAGWYDDHQPAEWEAFVDHGSNELGHLPVEGCWFESVDAAIQWTRLRSPIVLVRLGRTDDYTYSAGSTVANELVDGSGTYYPEWPPDNWPGYRGPSAESRRFKSTYKSSPVTEEADADWKPAARYSYNVVLLALDQLMGMQYAASLVVPSLLNVGDSVWFPTRGFDIWKVVRVIPTAESEWPNPHASAIGVGSSGTIVCEPH